jgi:hypothetical protein
MIGTDTVKQRVYTTLIVSGANRIVFNSLKLKASLKINILPQFARVKVVHVLHTFLLIDLFLVRSVLPTPLVCFVLSYYVSLCSEFRVAH